MKKYFLEKFHIIILVLLVLLFLVGSIHEHLWIKQMLKRPKYTIGEATTDWHQKNGNGVGTDYKYQVRDKIYFGTTSCSYKKGNRFLVIFDSVKPKNARVLGIYFIENHLTNLRIPIKGWKYLDVPFDIDSNTIKKYVKDWNVEPYEYEEEISPSLQ
jgi:hypothetical protein